EVNFEIVRERRHGRRVGGDIGAERSGHSSTLGAPSNRFRAGARGATRIQVADPEVEHDLLGPGPEVVGLGLERREHRRPVFLTPEAVLIGVEAEGIAVPGAQGDRVGGAQEVSADSKHTFHAAILPGWVSWTEERRPRPFDKKSFDFRTEAGASG